MILCKNLIPSDKIKTLDEWFEKCPPRGKKRQWVDGRSAKETAILWSSGIPQEFKAVLQPINLKYKFCSPEFNSKFDKYGGNVRNHDLLIIAENKSGKKMVISVESKVDEEFAKTLDKTIKAAKKSLIDNPNSKRLIRIKELRKVIFGSVSKEQLVIRYQLLHAIAGTLADAKRQETKTAIFLVQTLITSEINRNKYDQNQKALNDFLKLFTKDEHTSIKDGELLGPFRILGKTDLIPNDVDLWIGKYEIKI